MQLVLLRHGPAHDRADPACPPDAERELTRAGRRKTRAAVAGLARWLPRPVAVRTSPWPRARQTAELLGEALGGVEPVDEPLLLPGAPCFEALARLVAAAAPPVGAGADAAGVAGGLSGFAVREAASVACVVAVGHAPLLDELALAALSTPHPALAPLKKAGALCIADPGRSSARLLWLLPPRVLRALAHGEDGP